MSFTVGVVARFNASHHLVGDFGPSSLPHAHVYTVDADVEGGALREDGTLFDITRLQGALNEAIAEVEGRNLNDLPELAELNPTAEIVARYFFERLAAALRGQGLSQLEVRIWESAEAYASYRGDLSRTSRS